MFSIQLLNEITQFQQKKTQDNKLLEKKMFKTSIDESAQVFNILSVYKQHSIMHFTTFACWYSTFNFYLHLYKSVASVIVSYF